MHNKKEKKSVNPAVWILIFSFVVSAVSLGIYLAESDFSDKTLFFLLGVMRYSSFMVLFCSIFLIIAGIGRLIRKPSVPAVLKIILSFFTAMYGAGIIVYDAFIITFTGGI